MTKRNRPTSTDSSTGAKKARTGGTQDAPLGVSDNESAARNERPQSQV